MSLMYLKANSSRVTELENNKMVPSSNRNGFHMSLLRRSWWPLVQNSNDKTLKLALNKRHNVGQPSSSFKKQNVSKWTNSFQKDDFVVLNFTRSNTAMPLCIKWTRFLLFMEHSKCSNAFSLPRHKTTNGLMVSTKMRCLHY